MHTNTTESLCALFSRRKLKRNAFLSCVCLCRTEIRSRLRSNERSLLFNLLRLLRSSSLSVDDAVYSITFSLSHQMSSPGSPRRQAVRTSYPPPTPRLSQHDVLCARL
eukprot:6195483-Pleurochrysis_carterae.AAC.3